jgi:hypothetical protein
MCKELNCTNLNIYSQFQRVSVVMNSLQTNQGPFPIMSICQLTAPCEETKKSLNKSFTASVSSVVFLLMSKICYGVGGRTTSAVSFSCDRIVVPQITVEGTYPKHNLAEMFWWYLYPPLEYTKSLCPDIKGIFWYSSCSTQVIIEDYFGFVIFRLSSWVRMHEMFA